MNGNTLPRLVIGGIHSGGGKTTVTLGLLQAFANRKIRAMAFKCGPDYIDPLFHTRVIGLKSRNLDLFLSDGKTVLGLMRKHSEGQEIAVIEGVMGYYDGVGGKTEEAGTYDLARKTDSPAILVADARGMSLSQAAILKGFVDFRPDSHIRGVVFNRCAPSLYPLLKQIVEENTGLRPLGYLPNLPEAQIESRHLGLVTAGEIENLREKLNVLAAQCEKTLDLDGILALANTAPPFAIPPFSAPPVATFPLCLPERVTGTLSIGIADDAAFCFHYEDNYDLLRSCGAEMIPFSPLRDGRLPKGVSGLILPGGYPELYAQALSENVSMRESIRHAIEGGMPTLAECGGFLYLHRELLDVNGKASPMVGVIEGRAQRQGRMGHFGYATLTANKDNLLCREGESFRVHEFHYWQSDNEGECFGAKKPVSGASWPCVHASQSLYAGFPHLYFPGQPRLAESFAKACTAYALKSAGEEERLCFMD